MNNLMFPSSKNYPFSKQQKSYVKSIYKKLVLNQAMLGNLEAINNNRHWFPFRENDMLELRTTITDLQAELNMLKVGVIRL